MIETATRQRDRAQTVRARSQRASDASILPQSVSKSPSPRARALARQTQRFIEATTRPQQQRPTPSTRVRTEQQQLDFLLHLQLGVAQLLCNVGLLLWLFAASTHLSLCLLQDRHISQKHTHTRNVRTQTDTIPSATFLYPARQREKEKREKRLISLKQKNKNKYLLRLIFCLRER